MYKTSEYGNTNVFIIDQNFRIQYFNEGIARIYPNLSCGDYCYRDICDEDSICKHCAVVNNEENGSMYYNRVLGLWVETNCVRIDWPGSGPCIMVIVRKVQGRNRNLLHTLTNMSAYDELVELNLSNYKYRVLESREDKYRRIPAAGTSTELADRMKEGIIHPDDRKALGDLWDVENMRRRLNEQEKKNGMWARFRRQLLDGTYHWVQMIVVPLDYDEGDELLFMCFIQDIHDQVSLKEIGTVQGPGEPEKNLLTGLYWNAGFFGAANRRLEQSGDEPYCLLAVDIEHFKLYNEWHGREAGDEFLIHIADCLKKLEKELDCIAGYMGGDDFAALLPNRPGYLDRLLGQINEGARVYGKNAAFLPAYGLYVIDDKTVPISTMYDRAIIAMNEVKGNYARRLKRYDNRMIGQMEEDHILLSEVQRAIDQGQFIYYLQPQCNMETGKIVGFESLVRWQHPVRGMISPARFVPLLEKNGLISTLDYYVWDKICADIRRWLDQGLRPVPISVNVSRVDVLVLDVAECFCDLIQRYDLEPWMVEIEITETSYSEEYHVIMRVVEKLRAVGFQVLMDDFGSGYSSLNMLKDINVDILKLDMKFMDMNGGSLKRGVGIITAIVNMAKFMGLGLIAEGVETQEQVDFLLGIGCRCGQGYYFYRPLPAADCLEMMKTPDRLDYGGIQPLKVNQRSLRELMEDDLFNQMTLENLLGGVIMDTADAELRQQMKTMIDFLPVNIGMLYIGSQGHRFKMLVTGLAADSGYSFDEYMERIDSGRYFEDMVPEDGLRLKVGLEEAAANRCSYRQVIRIRHPERADLLWLDINARYVSDSNEGVIYLCVFSDVSAIKQQS